MGRLDTALGVVGIGLNAIGKSKEAKAQETVDRQNAARLQKEAEFQEYRTGIRLEELAEYKDAIIAKQRVQMAKAGIVVDANTAMRVIEDSARKYDKDRQALLMEGEFAVERALLGAQSSLESASQVKTSSYINIGRTLLSGAEEFDFFK